MDTSPKATSNVKQAVPFLMVSNLQGDAALMLQEYRKGRRPDGRLGQGVSICFQCEDAIALYRAFTLRGIDAKRPFVGNAMWVTSVTDPDSYRLDFESPTDVPEETVLEQS